MSSKHILFLLILMVCISPSLSRRRRRVNCRRMDCQVSRWSSWSACSSDVQCGQSVTRDRRRTVQIPASCGGTPCPSLLEAVPCQGTLRVDCQLSSWSTWSACSLLWGGSQTSSRYVATHEQCGGTACNSTLSKTRACNITRCLGKCSCTPRFYGDCCPNKVCQVPDCNGCCNAKTYKEINDPRRSTGSVWNKGERALCDRGLQWGWYRFTSFAGGKMPEDKVDSDHCGTHAPIWLNGRVGRHPTKKGENVVRQACVNAFDRNDGCWDYFDMNITNCGDYYVYYLKPPNYCSVAFCAGYKKPCPYGKDGEPPDCFDQPQEFSSDNLGIPEISINGDPEGVIEVTLRCKVNILNGIDKWRNVTYIIEWFSEGKSLLKNETICDGYILGEVHSESCPKNGTLVSKLPGTMYKIGQWISCNASAKFTTGRNVWSLPKTVREPFFAGLQFYPRTTILKLETCGLSMDKITVTPTIPARKNPRTDLFPMISFWLPPEIKLVNESQCQIPLNKTATIELQIMATCPKNENDITPGLKAIVPYISDLHSDFWMPRPCRNPPSPPCGPISLPTIWYITL